MQVMQACKCSGKATCCGVAHVWVLWGLPDAAALHIAGTVEASIGFPPGIVINRAMLWGDGLG